MLVYLYLRRRSGSSARTVCFVRQHDQATLCNVPSSLLVEADGGGLTCLSAHIAVRYESVAADVPGPEVTQIRHQMSITRWGQPAYFVGPSVSRVVSCSVVC